MRAKGTKITFKRTCTEQLRTEAGAASGSPSSDGTGPDSSSPAGKKQKSQPAPKVHPIVSECPSENDNLLLSCTLHKGLFSKKNMLLEREEVKKFFGCDKTIRSQGLNEDIEGMMRVVALVMALNTQGLYPQKDYDKLKRDHDALYDEFEAYKDKYKIQSGIIEDLSMESDKVKALEAEDKKLREPITELEDNARPAEEETEEEKALKTHTQLVEKIRELEEDCMGTLFVGFKTEVEQLKIVNPEVELVTKGISPYYLIVDGKIQTTSGDVDWDEEVIEEEEEDV